MLADELKAFACASDHGRKVSATAWPATFAGMRMHQSLAAAPFPRDPALAKGAPSPGAEHDAL